MEAPNNKMITADQAKTKEVPTEQEYFVPEHGKTVKATSPQEALAKAKELTDNKDI